MQHELKLTKDYFNCISKGIRLSIIRKKDGVYQLGDIFKIIEIDDNEKLETGRICYGQIVSIMNVDKLFPEGNLLIGIDPKD